MFCFFWGGRLGGMWPDLTPRRLSSCTVMLTHKYILRSDQHTRTATCFWRALRALTSGPFKHATFKDLTRTRRLSEEAIV